MTVSNLSGHLCDPYFVIRRAESTALSAKTVHLERLRRAHDERTTLWLNPDDIDAIAGRDAYQQANDKSKFQRMRNED